MTSLSNLTDRLNEYYHQVKQLILVRQHPVSGLLPASTAVTIHGDYTDAWVRDNVYSILAVWGLALAYRKIDENQGRTYELQQSVVKLMRGLLFAMMQQAEKVEQFKESQDPLEALHAKYDTATGSTVVKDDEWGHLQIDATSVFLLILAQMTASGLQIIFTLDEVSFVQNLVYYVGRAYRTPDYGIWERGNKLNHGKPELNASSVGMAKAALEAMDGLNLFGVQGGQASVIHVLPDEISRARITLESLLPRESGSKEVDAAVLSIIGYPAFAIEDADLASRTQQKIVDKLQGRYGCKRFLRDGHQAIIEDTTRLHYEPEELQQFEHIECEWPLFFAYLYLDGLFRQDAKAVRFYRQRLEAIAVSRNGFNLLPELYYVPKEAIADERDRPGSQNRLPNENVPLVWAQSLFMLGQMLEDNLITPGDVDPLGRHLRVGRRRPPIVQIALLAENEDLQQELATYGIETQIVDQVAPVKVYPSGELSAVYAQIGLNNKLGLSGRPIRRLRSLSTARVFNIKGETVVFLPSFLDPQKFYITLDYHFLVTQIRSELAYVYYHWNAPGRPTITLLLTHEMFELGRRPIYESPLLGLIQELKSGECSSIPVVVRPLYQLLLTAGTERIDDVGIYSFQPQQLRYMPRVSAYLPMVPEHTKPLDVWQLFNIEQQTSSTELVHQLQSSSNLYEQVELLARLCALEGPTFNTGIGQPDCSMTVAALLEEVYATASLQEHWLIVRWAAGLLRKIDVNLSDAVTELLVRQKYVTVGKSFSDGSLIRDPMPHSEVMEKIVEYCGEDERDLALTQEILIYLSVLIKAEPELFEGLLTLRVGYLILLLTSEMAREYKVPRDEAYDRLNALSPYEVKMRLRTVLASYSGLNKTLFQQESLHVKATAPITWGVVPAQIETESAAADWWRKRQIDGELTRLPEEFYLQVWELLHHCEGVIIGDKLDRRNRIDSESVISEMTPGEANFARRIDHLLTKIHAPEYRHLTVEALRELAAIFKGNPNLLFADYIALDVLVGHAVRLAWVEECPERAGRYQAQKAAAWTSFYKRSPKQCALYIAKALQFLVELAEAEAHAETAQTQEVA
ncbi:glycoside hydrolase family 15 protein [Oscillatoria sp. CS-180]|uniref:glycoside hydrolase family 15 protein n=1 Tax=Oscillatoria sp. CS-180 TaxID=3021720 RepID=UPI00232C8245|nr:glycoside hydrolase family 15 protein [Oscillatoria sp. CS-180]MDB9528790.1 glycoside hydrolase family 15 protein [Oscillatoria sp. CS-180]